LDRVNATTRKAVALTGSPWSSGWDRRKASSAGHFAGLSVALFLA